MPNRNTTAALVALAATLFVVGCGTDETGDARAFVKEVRATEPGPIKPPPEVSEYQPYTYEAGGRRPPFQLVQTEQEAEAVESGPRPDPNRPRGPLEKYALGALTMVGTLAIGGSTSALIRAPEGKIFRVTAGQYMGKNSGKILRITPTGLVLREIVPKAAGGYQKKRTKVTVGQ